MQDLRKISKGATPNTRKIYWWNLQLEVKLERGPYGQRPKGYMAFFGGEFARVQPHQKQMQTLSAGKIYNCTETGLGIAQFKTGDFCPLSTLAVRTNQWCPGLKFNCPNEIIAVGLPSE